jgi:hypothetical protein
VSDLMGFDVTWIIVLSVGLPILILVIVFGGIAIRSAQRNKLLQTGEPAQAIIQAVEQTGVYINNNPQIRMTVEVRPPNRPPYVTTITQTVGLIQIAAFMPGTLLDVRYDPADPRKVAIVSATPGGAMMGMMGGMSNMGMMQGQPMMQGMGGMPNAGMQGGPGVPMYSDMGQFEMMARDVLARGVIANATVLSVMDAGYNNGNMLGKKFQLLVQPEGRPPYQADAMGMLSPQALVRYVPGANIKVKFDPNNPSNVAIFSEQPQ